MLVSHEAVDGEARLVADAEPSLAEDVEALRLRGQQHLPQPLVPRLEPRDLVDYDLPLHGHAQAVRAAAATDRAGLAAGTTGGSCRMAIQYIFTMAQKVAKNWVKKLSKTAKRTLEKDMCA